MDLSLNFIVERITIWQKHLKMHYFTLSKKEWQDAFLKFKQSN
jgi:hypothetical protein